MKKLLSLFLMCVIMFSFSACGGRQAVNKENDNKNPTQNENVTQTPDSKTPNTESPDTSLPDEQSKPEVQVPDTLRHVTQIKDVNDLFDFAKSVNNGDTYAGETVYLKADIDLSGKEWIPIGKSRGTSFQGNFNGGNHTVKNMTIKTFNGNNANIGFFGYIVDGTVSTLKLEDINIDLSYTTSPGFVQIGGIAGYMQSQSIGVGISKCKVSGEISVSDTKNNALFIGGMVGGLDTNQPNTTYKMSLLESTVTFYIEGGMSYSGGIVGIVTTGDYNDENCTISDIIYNGTINDGATPDSRVGGFSGMFNCARNIDIKNCLILLKLNKTINYGEISNLTGLLVGDQVVGCQVMSLHHVYGNVTNRGSIISIPYVARNQNQIKYNSCNGNLNPSAPLNLPFDSKNWDLTNPDLPGFKF